MNNDAETLDSETLLRDYQVAVIGFNAATAILIHHLAASTLPTEREISAGGERSRGLLSPSANGSGIPIGRHKPAKKEARSGTPSQGPTSQPKLLVCIR